MRRVPYIPDGEAYRRHYGAGGIPGVFRGEVRQDGHGLGGLLSSLFRKVAPLLASTAKTAGKALLRSGAQVLSDVVSGDRDLKSSLKQRGIEGLRTIVSDIVKPSTSNQGRGGKQPVSRRRNRNQSLRSESTVGRRQSRPSQKFIRPARKRSASAGRRRGPKRKRADIFDN